MTCRVCAILAAKRDERLAELYNELATMLAEGDEYHAAMVKDEITASESLARLIHKHHH